MIAGGSGFIGRELSDYLLNQGHDVVVLTRKQRQASREGVTYVRWLQQDAVPEKQLGQVDVFINLSGVSINKGRWTAKHQKQIYQSRMEATDELIRLIRAMPNKPSVFINASAIGVYPASHEMVYTESSKQVAKDFLGKTVVDWEQKANSLQADGIHVALMRFGVVLGQEDGALPLMALPYKLFVGGTVGSGKQWVSWIHVTDVVRAITFAIETDELQGPVNLTAPTPVTMETFGKTIANVLHRPHWFPAPALAMKLALGQKSKLVLEGQHVLPVKLQQAGFEFLFPSLEQALSNLFQNNKKSR